VGGFDRNQQTWAFDPRLETRLSTFGTTVLPLSLANFAKLISDETDKWANAIKFASIKT
jgi:hypothetical protein